MNLDSVNFYGTSTIGERGQVVIPRKAREKLKIKSGEKLIFFGFDKTLHAVKASEFDKILKKLHEKFSKKIIKIKEEINN